MRRVIKGVLMAAAVVVLTGCVQLITEKDGNAHDEAAPFCADAAILGVARDKVCSVTSTGENYLRCVVATPFMGTVSCYTKYAALIGKDYRYCDNGEKGCVD